MRKGEDVKFGTIECCMILSTSSFSYPDFVLHESFIEDARECFHAMRSYNLKQT